MDSTIVAAVEKLKSGGVVVLPTETVYGLVANALNGDAVEKIFKIKGRPHNDPLILHVLNKEWLQRFSEYEAYADRVDKIVEKFWPGPVTVVLPKKDIIPDCVTSGLPTVAIRCPRHEIFRKILKLVNFPLAAPSANPFGYVSPTSANQVRQTLGNLVDIIVDGGKCDVGLESTIVDLTSETVKVLRPGAVTAQEISDAIDEPVIDYSSGVVSVNPKCPGQLKQHYCTNTKLVLFEHGGQPDILTEFNGKVAVIFNKRPLDCADDISGENVQGKDVFWFSETGDRYEIARNMFGLLQNLDNAGYDVIFCEKPEIHGLGVAINDRLLRASAKFSSKQNEQASI